MRHLTRQHNKTFRISHGKSYSYFVIWKA